MGSMTFQINDASTGSTYPAVWVTISENLDGTLDFQVSQQGGVVGDLRGLFFDLADESLLRSLIVTARSSDIRIGDDSIRDLGDGANMNGLTGSDGGYDVGIEIGTAGIGKDDVRNYSFTLDSSLRDLTLKDFSGVDFAVRLTSVGTIGGTRADSSKLLERTSMALDLQNEVTSVDENLTDRGSLLGHVGLPGDTVITSWSGGVAGSSIALTSEGNTIGALTLNQDGSFLLDASAADELSAGESIVFSLDYNARNQDEATSWSSDSAKFTVVIRGVNDGPVALNDDAGAVEESSTVTGNALANDSDIDRLDVLSVSAVNGEAVGAPVRLASGATVTMHADGTYTYDTNGAFDHLNSGETASDRFDYTIDDGHGGSATATVSIAIIGAGGGEPPVPPPPPQTPVDVFPTMLQNISNVVLYLDDGNRTTALLKVKLQPEGLQINDIDLLHIDQFLATHGEVLGGNTHLVGISVHAGQEYPNLAGIDMTAPGEGAFFFLLDGETPVIEAIGERAARGWTADWSNDDIPLTQEALDAGLSYALLAQQATTVFSTLDPNTGMWL